MLQNEKQKDKLGLSWAKLSPSWGFSLNEIGLNGVLSSQFGWVGAELDNRTIFVNILIQIRPTIIEGNWMQNLIIVRTFLESLV